VRHHVHFEGLENQIKNKISRSSIFGRVKFIGNYNGSGVRFLSIWTCYISHEDNKTYNTNDSGL
jgi:hypothetical protein